MVGMGILNDLCSFHARNSFLPWCCLYHFTPVPFVMSNDMFVPRALSFYWIRVRRDELRTSLKLAPNIPGVRIRGPS